MNTSSNPSALGDIHVFLSIIDISKVKVGDPEEKLKDKKRCIKKGKK